MDAKLLFILTQQTPMIHFQWKENGAILRASDVKPRLDSFIYEWVGKNCEFKSVKEEWKIDSEHKALNYKMKFVIPQNTEHEKPQFPSSDVYFGNMGQNVEKKKTVLYKGDIELQIICFYEELREILINCMETFFLTHNFGTRQNRGLGSFALKEIISGDKPDNRKNNLGDAEKILRSWYGKPIYKIDYNEINTITVDDILYDGSVIYKILKSGINDGSWVYRHDINGTITYSSDKTEINKSDIVKSRNIYIKSFLTKWFLGRERPIAGEKRFMKVNDLAPKLSKKITQRIIGKGVIESEQEIDNGEYRYIRGLLGITDQVKFIDQFDDEWKGTAKSVYNNGKKDRLEDIVRIESCDDDQTVERYPSPVFYKILDKTLYIIPLTPPEEAQIFGKKFLLTAVPDSNSEGEFKTKYNRTSLEIQIPSKDEFDMDQLWRDYIKYLKSEKDNKLSLLHQYNIAQKRRKKELYFLRNNVVIDSCESKGVNA